MNDFTIEENRALKDLSTFKIGGPARYCIEVKTIESMKKALAYCQENNLRFFILGKGSNCLFDDKGFNGVVIVNKIDFIHFIKPELIHVGAGYSFSLLGTQTARLNLSGLEFASGIPGTVGGAVFMNAGANQSDTASVLVSVDYLNVKGELQTLPKEELIFSYRFSSFQTLNLFRLNPLGAIVGATFQLKPSTEARTKQLDIISYRKKTQPYHLPSAGCIFRNPTCGPAGILIDKNQLKGFKVGGAEVSEMHANFIVNIDNASSQDVLTLIMKIKKKIKEETGVELESEVRYIPYDNSNSR